VCDAINTSIISVCAAPASSAAKKQNCCVCLHRTCHSDKWQAFTKHIVSLRNYAAKADAVAAVAAAAVSNKFSSTRHFEL